MKLFEISDKIEQILAREVDHETGEITEETEKALDELEMERTEIALHIARYIKGEFAEAKAVQEQAKILNERGRRHTKRGEDLLNYLKKNLPAGEEVKDATSRIRWRKSRSVEQRFPDDPIESYVPEKYIRKKVVLSLDKKLAAEDFKKGEEIIGLIWKENDNIKVE